MITSWALRAFRPQGTSLLRHHLCPFHLIIHTGWSSPWSMALRALCEPLLTSSSGFFCCLVCTPTCPCAWVASLPNTWGRGCALPCFKLLLDLECPSAPSLAGKNPLNLEGLVQTLAPLWILPKFPVSATSSQYYQSSLNTSFQGVCALICLYRHSWPQHHPIPCPYRTLSPWRTGLESFLL